MAELQDLRDAARALYDYPKAKRRGDRRIVDAVESVMEAQAAYHNGNDRLRMIQLKYFRQTHTLQGVAMQTNYSLQTVKRWNGEILSGVSSALIRGDKEKGPGG